VFKRSELRNMPRNELTDLLTNTLYALMLNIGEEKGYILPDGFTLKTETDNLEITFDVDIDTKIKKSSVKAVKDFINNCSCHIYKPGELNE